MTDKELRRLSRSDLLELLISQTEENQALKTRVAQLEDQLNDRRIAVAEAGSIAEASLKLNCVFAAAEEAARQYLENIQRIQQEQEASSQSLREKAGQEAEAIRQEAEAYSQKLRGEADAYWKQIEERAAEQRKDQDTENVDSDGKGITE